MVDVFGPMGLATFDPSEARDLVCLVGGSGIAGIMSVLDQAVAINHFQRHKLFILENSPRENMLTVGFIRTERFLRKRSQKSFARYGCRSVMNQNFLTPIPSEQ